MYFDKFPVLEYIDNFSSETSKVRLVTDILRRVKLSTKTLDETELFFVYELQDGDTPESISHRLYGDSQFFWVVCLANNIINPYYDFILSSLSLENYSSKKYEGSYFYLVDPDDEKKFTGITFAPDETIFSTSTITDDFGTIQENYTVRARIKRHEPTLGRVHVDGGEYTYFTENSLIGIIKGSTTQRAKLKKIENDIYALKRFQKSDGEVLNPLSAIDDETPLGQTSDSHPTPVELYQTRIGAYLGLSGDRRLDNAVTNLESEFTANESIRFLRLINPTYLGDITGAFKELIEL